jgi:hypothetical protein
MGAGLRSKIQTAFSQLRNRSNVVGEDTPYDPPTLTITDSPAAVDNVDGAIPSNSSHLSFLYSLTRRWAWVAVAHRCETHPHEAQRKEQDVHGDTILHWACFGSPPLYVVEAILRVCPELVTIPNGKGLLPLHTACCYRASSEVIRALVQAHTPSAGRIVDSTTEQGGSTPLHLLCDYGCRTDSLRAVLESPEGAASTQRNDRIYCRRPLEILNERKNMNEFHSHLAELRRLTQRNPNALHLTEDGQRQDQTMETKLLLERIHTMGFWEKVELLAIAEYTQQPLAPVEQLGIPQSTTTVVHALLGLKHCPPPVLEFACFLMPHALLEKDDHGDLPLHIAARRSCDDMIQDILEAQPLAAAVPDATGSLPLKLYVGRRHVPSWNALMKAFIVAFPSAVEHLDLDRRLYPLLWSRLNRRPSICNPSEDLDALFLSVQSALDTLIVVS